MDQLKILFDECDVVRFTTFKQDSKSAQESVKRCEEIIDYFERTIKS